MPTSGNGSESETRYRCTSAPVVGTACGNKTVRASALERMVEESFLYDVGDLEVIRRTLIPGTDDRPEIDSLEEVVERLAASLVGPVPESLPEVLFRASAGVYHRYGSKRFD